MSQNELIKISNVYSFSFDPAVDGVSTNDVLNFYLGTSKVLGLKTSGTYDGIPYIRSISPPETADTGAAIVINSTDDTDVGVVTMYWVNESAYGLLNG
jgi:hypothetical protein